MSKLSREKGKRGEREVAHLFTAAGYPSRRGAQHKGGPDSPDCVVEGFPVRIHPEVKLRNTCQPYVFLEQAIEEAPAGAIPVVFHRRDREEWIVIMRASDFIDLGRRIMGAA